MPRYVSKGVKEPMKTPQQLMREQMDELMGKGRNVPLDERDNSRPAFSDEDIDKYYLCGCSPYELLRGTKSETMPQFERDGFLRQKSEGLRMEWEALPQEEKDRYGYERQLRDFLEVLVEEQDRRIAKSKERYERENDAPPVIPFEAQQQMNSLKDQIKELQAKSEALGEAGDVDASMAAFNAANAIQLQWQEVERKATGPLAQKKQYVDEVSGLVYSSTDNEARIADLQSGRQYKGWKAIRDKLAELRARPLPPAGAASSSGAPPVRKDRPDDDRRPDDRRPDDRRYDDRRPDDRRPDDRRYLERRYDDRRRDDRRRDYDAPDDRGYRGYDRDRGYDRRY